MIRPERGKKRTEACHDAEKPSCASGETPEDGPANASVGRQADDTYPRGHVGARCRGGRREEVGNWSSEYEPSSPPSGLTALVPPRRARGRATMAKIKREAVVVDGPDSSSDEENGEGLGGSLSTLETPSVTSGTIILHVSCCSGGRGT